MFQEISGGVAVPGPGPEVHSLVVGVVHRFQEAAELVSAALIAIGVVIAVYHLVRLLLTSRKKSLREQRTQYQWTRLNLSRFLAMALEFQLAADLLGTIIAPSWNQLGQLGAIAAIRTFLNYFLAREIREEESEAMELQSYKASE